MNSPHYNRRPANGSNNHDTSGFKIKTMYLVKNRTILHKEDSIIWIPSSNSPIYNNHEWITMSVSPTNNQTYISKSLITVNYKNDPASSTWKEIPELTKKADNQTLTVFEVQLGQNFRTQRHSNQGYQNTEYKVTISLELKNASNESHTVELIKYVNACYLPISNVPIVNIVIEGLKFPAEEKEETFIWEDGHQETFTSWLPVNLSMEINSSNAVQGQVFSMDNLGGINNGNIEMSKDYASQSPKKNFIIQLPLSQSIFGLSTANRWLIEGNYVDRTHAANSMSCDLFRQMGHEAVKRVQIVLYLNNYYYGICTVTNFNEDVLSLKIDNNPELSDYVYSYNSYTQPDEMDITTSLYQFVTLIKPNKTVAYIDYLGSILNKFTNDLVNKQDWRNYKDEISEIDLLILRDLFCIEAIDPAFHMALEYIKNKKIYTGIQDFRLAFNKLTWDNNDISLAQKNTLFFNEILLSPDGEPNYAFSDIHMYRLKDQKYIDSFKKRYVELRKDILSEKNISEMLQQFNKFQLLYDIDKKQYPVYQVENSEGIMTDVSDLDIKEFHKRILHRLELMDVKVPKIEVFTDAQKNKRL